MHRFYLPAERWLGTDLVLDGREAHHAMDVLRVRPGERVAVLDGQGRESLCEVRQYGRNAVSLAVLETRIHAPLACRVTLLQALPKGKLIESIIQKATELGVWRVVPLLSERVVPHLEGDEPARKAGKWQGAAVEAVKQCGCPWLPLVETPLTLEEYVSRREPSELGLVGSLQENARHPREHFRAFQAAHRRPPRTVEIWVGPEGDFSPGELQRIQTAGALPITLGRFVLRSDTAAVYCLSIVNYELQSSPV
jgi:16S rRNA (uracil1498-N3)-methyltransferase